MSLDLLCGLFAAQDHVVCAVSGGADSMALLWSLYALRSELSITVAAAHFNHHLRGEEADRDEAFVRDFCKKHGIELSVGSGDVRAYAQEHGKSIEDAARTLRYAFLQSLPCDKIAVAHHADDNAETVLLHLLRGSGLRGLCGISPVRGKIVRPLLNITRADIESYLRREGIAWVEDASNTSADYTRNRVRHEILPLFKRENPNFLNTISTQSSLLRADDALLDFYAQELVTAAKEGKRYRCDTILSAPDALQKRALRLIVREYLPQDVSLVHIAAMQSLLAKTSPSAQLSLPQQLLVRRCYDFFEIAVADGETTFPSTTLCVPGETIILSLGLKITCKITENLQLFANTPFHFAVKYDMIAQHEIIVRPRQSGDELTLSCRKSLKKRFIDHKIPLFEREKIPVFACNGKVLAVLGFGVDRAFCPTASEAALMISVEKLPISGESI